MPNFDKGDLIIAAYYAVAVCFGFFCVKPKLVFYLSVVLALVTCALLFQLRIYIELGGIAQTVPFAFVPWFIARQRLKRKQQRQN